MMSKQNASKKHRLNNFSRDCFLSRTVSFLTLKLARGLKVIQNLRTVPKRMRNLGRRNDFLYND
jgi:hypothetical protein